MYDDETEMLEPLSSARQPSSDSRHANTIGLIVYTPSDGRPVVLCILRSSCNYMRTAGSPGARLELQCAWMHVSGRVRE